ncbi:MAG TPA: hypothetical protein VHZ33_27140 [Trebonia sp.]|jgi:hypothetical protein|nr:hypothetical protein [Trebonia sp.]
MTQEIEHGATRRTVIRTAAVVGTTAALAAAGATLGAGAASAAPTVRRGRLPYPPGVTDTSHCTPEVAELFRGLFTAKSEHDAPRLMSYFSKKSAYYIDASSGGLWPSWQALNEFYTPYFASGLPAAALSYPLRVVGDASSALVEFEDRPQFFGHELRILGSVTFDSDRKIIRWIDYWDGRSSLVQNSIAATYPTNFEDGVERTSPAVARVASALAASFGAGDVDGALALMSYDVVHEDMAAHTRVRGQLQAGRYYDRALADLPYGTGSSLAHVEGGRLGGGYEWHASAVASPMRRGHTCLELDESGLISRLTAVYDSSLLSYQAYQALVAQGAEAPL